MGVESNLIHSLEVCGTELALDSFNNLGLIVADEIAETRIGMVWEVEWQGECMMDGQQNIGGLRGQRKRYARGGDQVQ
jgi:hypothetical protein